jgi:hypothetical protein
MYLTQMVNTRRGGGIDLPPRRHTRRIFRQPQPQPAEMNPPNPPPGGVDPLVAAQMRMMQQMADTMADMRAQMQQERQEMRQEREEIRQELRQEREEIRQERGAQQQLQQQFQQQQQQQQVPLPPPPPPVPPRDKHREFMSHKPLTFASSPDPLDADDWLKSIEKMLNIAQCSDREKVLYASSRLTGPATDWWDSYTVAYDAADTITWAEFSTQFRNYHIPAGLMKIKKEFLSLKQGNMSVSEYRDKFIQLSRYAPEEVAEDERKQEHFIEGLNGPLQYVLVAHTFPSFQRLLDKALAIEHKRVQLGDLKRKAISQGQGSRVHRPDQEDHAQLSTLHRGLHGHLLLVRLLPLAPRRGLQDRRLALHASSAVRLGTMLMLVRWEILVHQLRTSSRLLARDILLPG